MVELLGLTVLVSLVSTVTAVLLAGVVDVTLRSERAAVAHGQSYSANSRCSAPSTVITPPYGTIHCGRV